MSTFGMSWHLLLPVDLPGLHRQFFRLKLSADIQSALDGSRKPKQRQVTFNRLRKVATFIQACTAVNISSGTLQVKTCQ